MEPSTKERLGAVGFEQLITRYFGYVHAIVTRIVGTYSTREDIEECTADVLVAIWQSQGQYDPERGGHQSYVAAIARNKAITLRDKLMKGAKCLPFDEDILVLDTIDPLGECVESELRTIMREAVTSLDPPDPEIFTRRYYWGESLDAISAAIGLSVRAIEGRLYRGRKRLKAYLEGRL